VSRFTPAIVRRALALLLLSGCTQASFHFNEAGSAGAHRANPAPTSMDPSPNSNAYGLSQNADSKLRLGDKVYVKSVLDEIFGPSAAAATTQFVDSQTAAFGGPCEVFNADNNRCDSARANTQAAILPTSITTREAYRMRTCYTITSTDGVYDGVQKKTVSVMNSTAHPTVYAANQALGRDAFGKTADLTPPTASDLAAAYALFFPTRTPPESVIHNLQAVADAARATYPAPANNPNLEAWRNVLLTLCLAPDWQIP
jgi:hypothetical protein